MENNVEWYSPQKMLSYDQYINMIIGGRGIGKTFGLKRHLFKKSVFKNKAFIYLRRNKTELDRIDKEKFFTTDLLKSVFNDFEIIEFDASKVQTKIIFSASNTETEINTMIISSTKIIFNSRVICYMKSLSTWVDLKGSEYDDVDDILFDEVLIDVSSKKNYLKDEVKAFLNLVYSVFRQRKGCHAYLLSNATNFNNPYFAFLKFTETDKSKRFYNLKHKAFLIEFPPNKPFQGQNSDNPFLKLIEGTDAYGSIVDNDFQVLRDNNIQQLKGNKIRLFSFIIDSTFITCYSVNGVVYVAKGFDKNLAVYTINIEEVENGFMFLEKTSIVSKQIKKNYLGNLLIYADLETKIKFMEVINYVQ